VEGEIEYEREIVSHDGSAVIVPLTRDKTASSTISSRRRKISVGILAGSLENDEKLGRRGANSKKKSATAGVRIAVSPTFRPGFFCRKNVCLSGNRFDLKRRRISKPTS